MSKLKLGVNHDNSVMFCSYNSKTSAKTEWMQNLQKFISTEDGLLLLVTRHCFIKQLGGLATSTPNLLFFSWRDWTNSLGS
jgi:hypothetical protein